jgi:hypothetical protein
VGVCVAMKRSIHYKPQISSDLVMCYFSMNSTDDNSKLCEISERSVFTKSKLNNNNITNE